MTEKKALLQKFMKEHFPFTLCKQLGIFTQEMKGNYQVQAARICEFFGLQSIYEWGAESVSCHLSYAEDRPLSINTNGRIEEEPFITTIKSIYE